MRTIIKQLFTLDIPLAAPRFMHTLNTLIVMLFIAQLGHDTLAASFTMATTRIIMLVIFCPLSLPSAAWSADKNLTSQKKK